MHHQEPRTTLDLERLHRTGGDPEARSSQQAPPSPVNTINPRVRVLEKPPSPSPDPPVYWPIELLDLATSLRGCREPPCIIHSWGPHPYLVASRRLRFSSSGHGEGGEGNADDEEEDPNEIFSVLDSPLRPGPRHTARIQVGVQGRPTRILAPRSGVRGLKGGSPVTGSTVWPPPPPPSSSASSSLVQCHHHHKKMTPRPSHHSEAPSGARSFITSPTSPPLADPVTDRGLGISRADLEYRMRWGWRWGRWWRGEKGNGVGESCRRGGESKLDHGAKRSQERSQRVARAQGKEGVCGLGFNPTPPPIPLPTPGIKMDRARPHRWASWAVTIAGSGRRAVGWLPDGPALGRRPRARPPWPSGPGHTVLRHIFLFFF
jgi:hypothetical protein